MKNDPTKINNRKPASRKSPIQEVTNQDASVGDDVSDLFSRDTAGRVLDPSHSGSGPGGTRSGAAGIRRREPSAPGDESDENQLEVRLRPKRFDEFPGQDIVKQKLSVFLQAAKLRGEPLDHTLLSGPPGLGKTTLAHILAAELGVDMKSTSGPALDKKGDVAAILTSLKPNSILFIDEIHRLNKHVEEYLYSAMEDFFIDIITGEGWGARTMRFQLAPFTLIGATTRTGLLNAPFRDRFGIVERLQFYNPEDLQKILARSAELLKIEMHPDGGMEIARRCRGTPRIANRLLKRVRDYAQVKGNGQIDQKIASYALGELDVDHRGLDAMDRRILRLMIEKLNGGPAGIDTLSAALSEERDTLEEVYEPFLIQEGFLQKTPRGRIVTRLGYEHLKIPIPRALTASITLIEEQVDFDIT